MNERKETVQWAYDFLNISYAYRNHDSKDAKESTYYWYLFPFCESYINPLNPIILSISNQVNSVLSKKVLMIRDGHIPLYHFFKENKYRADFPTLFIHKDFWYLVPEEWREHTKFYDINSNHIFTKENPPKNIFITGQLNGTFNDQIELEEDIEALALKLSPEIISKSNISAYFPINRSDLWGGWKNENSLNSIQCIFKNFGTNIHFPIWDSLNKEMSFKDTLYIEFNRGHFLKETYLKTMFLSRGASLLEPDQEHSELFKFKNKIELSFNHHINIYDIEWTLTEKYFDPMDSRYYKFFKMILEKQYRGMNLDKDWDHWFGTYLKRYNKLKNKYDFN